MAFNMLLDQKQANSFKTSPKQIFDEDADSCGASSMASTMISAKKLFVDLPDREMAAGIMGTQDNAKWRTSLCHIPYSVTRQLMLSLDAFQGFETLAAAVGYTSEKMQLLTLELHKSEGSPTRTLLWDLGCQNYKVRDLYEKLRLANRQREMSILENYVATEEKKSLPSASACGFSSLPRHSGSGPGTDMQSIFPYLSMQDPQSGKGFGPPGSANNFNHMSGMDKAAAVNTGMRKQYDDKVIPGTEPHALALVSGSSNGAVGGYHSGSNDSQYAMPMELPQRLGPPSETSDHLSDSSRPSLASTFHVPEMQGSSGGSVSMPSSGVEKIQQLLREESQSSSASGSGGGSSQSQRLDHTISTSSSHSQRLDSVFTGASQSQRLDSAFMSDSGRPQRADSTVSTTSSSSEADFALSVKTTFSHSDLVQATGGFSEKNLLGEGAFGTVYRGHLRHLDCAVKILKKTEEKPTDNCSQLRSELTTLLKYQHENIVTLYGYALDGPDLCLVYQYLEMGSLEDRLGLKDGTDPLSWERRMNIIVGAVTGLNFLHKFGKQPLIHGDIKSANILLDKYCEAKIGDLGQASYATKNSGGDTKGFTHFTKADTKTKQFGTQAYLPHDVIGSGRLSINIQSDIFAMGVVFLEVLSGLKAYDPDRGGGHFLAAYVIDCIQSKYDEGEWQAEFQDKRAANDMSAELFISCMKLAKKCTAQIKKARPTSEKLLESVKELYKKFCEVSRELRRQYSDVSTDSSGPTSSMQISSTDSLYQHQSCESELGVVSCGPTSSTPTPLHMSLPPQSSNVSQLQSQRSMPYRSAHSSLPYSPPMPGSSYSPHGNSVERLQQQRFQQFQSVHTEQSGKFPQTNSQLSSSSPQHFAPSDVSQSMVPPPHQRGLHHQPVGAGMGNVGPTAGPLLHQMEPQSEALQLQRMYDMQEQKKKIDSLPDLSGVTPQPNPHNSSSSVAPLGHSQTPSFDEQNVPVTSEQADSLFIDHPTDPKKLEYIRNWDGNAYKNEPDPQSYNHTGSVNVASPPSMVKGNVESVRYNTGHGCDSSTCEESVGQESPLGARRESDVDNNALGIGHGDVDSSEVDSSSSVTKKTNPFFSRYKLERETLSQENELDDDDNDT
ncbi:uncharacterized protein LOC101845840 [Aplysia californica]|uniref:Uncharacterized protein LOC101845840 n=1 Tax=Aplysia californica TaxID=6500 RepID=A0ABM0JKJ5_APLCA|nr:uncharacterized protein LOC101845840 [Aplysia californica]